MKIFKTKVKNNKKIITFCGMKIYSKKNKNTSEIEKIFQKNKGKPRFIESKIVFQHRELTVPDAPSFAHQLKEIFEKEIYKFISQDTSPLIYDCGANVGTSVLYFKQLYPQSRIKAFEADKKICNTLVNNIAGLDNVEIFHNAVWINNDELSFNSEGADGGSLINSFEQTETVKGIRLKEYIEAEEKIHFLKIDIEGAETDVIVDCKDVLHKVDNIFIEYHSMCNTTQTLDVLLNALTGAGFRYHVENISSQRLPYIERSIRCNMDLQVNIFGYRGE